MSSLNSFCFLLWVQQELFIRYNYYVFLKCDVHVYLHTLFTLSPLPLLSLSLPHSSLPPLSLPPSPPLPLPPSLPPSPLPPSLSSPPSLSLSLPLGGVVCVWGGGGGDQEKLFSFPRPTRLQQAVSIVYFHTGGFNHGYYSSIKGTLKHRYYSSILRY